MFSIIGAIIETVATVLPKIIEIVGANLLQFAHILSGIFKGLGLLAPEEEITDLGDKAIQAEKQGIKAENYDSYEEYLKAVKSFEIDEEKSANIDDNAKI